MKILIIMEGFFPGKKYGGPPVSIDNFCTLMRGHECFIVTHNHDLFESEPYKNIKKGWNNRENCKVLYLNDEEYNKRGFEKAINSINPDILYLQGVFQQCVLPCLKLAKKYNIKVLLAPRGELCTGAFNMKKYKKAPYLRFLQIMRLVENVHYQSTSDEETEAIKRLLGGSMSHIHRIDNIPSIPKKNYLRKEKKRGIGRFVFLSRIHPKKNLLSAIGFFNNITGEAIFDIYGPIEDEAYWKECQEAIKKLPRNVRCEYKGLVSHDQVHEVFCQYDAFLFPTLSENYGHVIAESLSVGTPVIISDQTPWNENNHFSCYVCGLNDKNGYIKAIQRIIDLECIDSNKIIKWMQQRQNISTLANCYLDVFTRSIMGN